MSSAAIYVRVLASWSRVSAAAINRHTLACRHANDKLASANTEAKQVACADKLFREKGGPPSVTLTRGASATMCQDDSVTPKGWGPRSHASLIHEVRLPAMCGVGVRMHVR